ncbi:helix-turn-helix transcriptional regulator [Variovorax sp. tm]|uniref:helix-turn-helix transcriptional regulator n=1 Tax=Variovorax atrisoli TaxID=3394203 RepID=UPI003A81107F
MNNSNFSDPLDQPPVILAPRGLQARIVDLPNKNFLSCNELAFAIADALVGRLEAMPPSSETRASWTESIGPSALYPRSYAARQLIKQRRQEPGEVAPSKASPLISPERERWLDACAHRLQDLQAWVTREKLQVFTAARTKARSAAPGTYLRRADAVQYCLESGFDLKEPVIADGQASQRVPAAPADLGSNARTERRQASKVQGKTSASSESKAIAPAEIPASHPRKPGSRLLRAKEAILRTGLSRSSFYERQNPKSQYFDATFPTAVQLGQSAMGYREDELDAWIASRPAKER